MKKNKYYIITIVILVILLFTQRCENSDKYEALKTELSKQKNVVKEISQKRLKEKDSLEFQITQREVLNNVLTQENDKLKDKIKTVSNRQNIKIKGLENLVDYFNDRFEVKDNIVIENKVGLTESTASDITWELEEFDKVSEVVVLQDSVIKNQDVVILNLNKDKVDLSSIVFSAENEIKEREKLQDLAEQNIENLENQVKKQKNKNFWNKVLIGVGVVGGFFIGNNL